MQTIQRLVLILLATASASFAQYRLNQVSIQCSKQYGTVVPCQARDVTTSPTGYAATQITGNCSTHNVGWSGAINVGSSRTLFCTSSCHVKADSYTTWQIGSTVDNDYLESTSDSSVNGSIVGYVFSKQDCGNNGYVSGPQVRKCS